ncbi:MAG: hypothetical protein ACREL5_05590 [Gemmatimonadales bacterium]
MPRDRAGRGALGCLLTILLVGIVAYIGIQFLPPWMRYEQFEDEMRTDARFGVTLADSVIMVRLQATADTLGLPPAAHRISIRRTIVPAKIIIQSTYVEHVKLPIFGIKSMTFHASAEESL